MSDVSKNDPHPQVVEGMMAFTIAGFPVFPLARNKRPGVPEWGPLRTTPPDLAQVEGVGVATFRRVRRDLRSRATPVDDRLRSRVHGADSSKCVPASTLPGWVDVFESWLQRLLRGNTQRRDACRGAVSVTAWRCLATRNGRWRHSPKC